MPNLRTGTARWLEARQMWRIDVQKNGDRRSFYSGTPGRKGQREANAKADKWLDANVDYDSRVEKLAEEWLADIQDSTGTGNFQNVKKIYELYILPVIGKKKISSLTDQDLQKVINNAYAHPKRGKTLSEKYLKDIRGCLTSLMKFARKKRCISWVPEALNIPKGAKPSAKTILSDEGIYFLLNEADDYYINLFRLFLYTGLRPGEMLHIKKDEVDLENGKLYISGAYNELGEETFGKNRNAIRTVMLSDEAIKIIKRQLAKGQNSELLFADIYGAPAKQKTVSSHWRRLLKDNGIPHVSLYELRHTFISHAEDSGMPMHILQSMVGHSSRMDTNKHYGHKTSKADEIAKEYMNKVLK